MNSAAIFLDRDGTIIEDVGYIKKPQDVNFFPGSFTALLKLQQRFLLFIVTNQSGISKGITSEDEVKQVNKYLVDTLESKGIFITQVFCCPHTNEDNCRCKKPKPYFINLAKELYQLDLKRSYIVGDHPSDVECGINAGITPIYLLTGHGEKHKDDLDTNTIIAKDILEAVKIITNTHNKY